MNSTLKALVEQAIKLLQSMLVELNKPTTQPVVTNREKLLAIAKTFIGQDITPGDEIPDDVACVAQLQEVMKRFRNSYIGSGAALYNTASLLTQLLKDADFTKVTSPLPGDIILSATGSGNGSIPGHTGIVSDNNIMSNSSFTGLWSTAYTLESWEKRYAVGGGMKTNFFRIKG